MTLPAQAAAGADEVAVAGVYSQAFYSGDTVTDLQIVAPAGYPTVNGAATNNVTFTVRQIQGGVPIANLGTLTLGAGETLSSECALSIPVGAQPILQPGDLLDVLMHQNGAGQTITAGLMVSIFVS
ncbi:hypothetical protein OHB26_16460 [Nocardia sp. NBC_01503]|uniref:hypothetical protein n=1 Tax=Nocardia sp. NBC_01503 TaxID=2975997 RepID=UPI002E7C3ABA|nr:hypothetical protein [Nocardia sp. NBC_01503]WTL35644.1 hypothetical protein OHB26_16460 [Nocardia sp. NBC_01503]